MKDSQVFMNIQQTKGEIDIMFNYSYQTFEAARLREKRKNLVMNIVSGIGIVVFFIFWLSGGF